jgi:hypothetical protein
MKYLLIILLFVSLGINAYFGKKKYARFAESKKKETLYFWKTTTHKEGYQFFSTEVKKHWPAADLSQKNCVICFWDSTAFDFNALITMRAMDSLAGVVGKYKYHYIFATEMEAKATEDFLKRNEVVFENFKVMSQMDDFISGVFNERPLKWKSLGPKKDSAKVNPNCPDFSKMKIKPYYLIMDPQSKILYSTGKWFLPQKDTAFLRRLNSDTEIKTVKN